MRDWIPRFNIDREFFFVTKSTPLWVPTCLQWQHVGFFAERSQNETHHYDMCTVDSEHTWSDNPNPLTHLQPSAVDQRFSTAGPRPSTGPWHQLYRAARSSPGSCHFSFLSIFHE
jgi:hypothetical protein